MDLKLFLTILAALIAFFLVWPLVIALFKLTLGLAQLALVVVFVLLIVSVIRRFLRV